LNHLACKLDPNQQNKPAIILYSILEYFQAWCLYAKFTFCAWSQQQGSVNSLSLLFELLPLVVRNQWYNLWGIHTRHISEPINKNFKTWILTREWLYFHTNWVLLETLSQKIEPSLQGLWWVILLSFHLFFSFLPISMFWPHNVQEGQDKQSHHATYLQLVMIDIYLFEPVIHCLYF
jgi:hypothetical protein